MRNTRPKQKMARQCLALVTRGPRIGKRCRRLTHNTSGICAKHEIEQRELIQRNQDLDVSNALPDANTDSDGMLDSIYDGAYQ